MTSLKPKSITVQFGSSLKPLAQTVLRVDLEDILYSEVIQDLNRRRIFKPHEIQSKMSQNISEGESETYGGNRSSRGGE